MNVIGMAFWIFYKSSFKRGRDEGWSKRNVTSSHFLCP
jgi:hypothetical protein